MVCTRCKHEDVKKFGTYGKRHIQRYRCTSCRTTFSEPQPKFGAHYTDAETAAKVLALMLEGVSIRAIGRLTDLHIQTILDLMHTASENARKVFDARVRDIRPKFVQLDELWCMIGCHGKRVTIESPADWGDAWTWLALDSQSKMIRR